MPAAEVPEPAVLPSLRENRQPYRLGIARYTTCGMNFEETLRLLRQIDCHYMGLKEGTISYDATDDEIAAYKAKCATFGVEVVSAGPLYFETEEQLAACVKFAKRYGMKYISVVPREKNPKWVEGMPPREMWLESDRMMDVLERYVRAYDIRAAVHNHGPDNAYLYPTAEAALKRIGARDRRIGVCLDIGHERRAGLDPVRFIRAHGDRIVEVHAKNIEIDPVKNIAMPGPRGNLDLPGILKALSDVGYDGYCLIEYERDFACNALPLAETVGYFRGVMDATAVKPRMKPVPAGANTLTADEKAAGFELLFDGKNLPTDTFVSAKDGCKAFPSKGWFVKDGTLTMRPVNGITPDGRWFPLPPEDQKLGGGGDIVTVKKYRDFEMTFDFRLTRAANSGVKYFIDEGVNGGTGEEYQILEPEHPDADKGRDGNRRVAALYDVFPANGADALVKPAGQWNAGRVIVKGAHVEHWLNGVRVLQYERGSEAFRAAVAKSKYATWGKTADGRPQPWGEVPEGRILLQDHSDSTVSFCNLKIRPL